MTDPKTSAKGFDYARKIGALIAMAEDESLSLDVRANYRAKAEGLMREYQIEEEQTIAQDAFSILPVTREIIIMESQAFNNSLAHDYAELFREIANHAGLRFTLEYRYDEEAQNLSHFARRDSAAMIAMVTGYDIDIRVAEFYWTAARLVFMTRIDAKPQANLSDQENCYYLRNSGQPRNLIAQMLWKSDLKDGAAHGKVQKLYLAECAVRGEKPLVAGRGLQVDQYREAYANSFVSEFGWRLREARTAAEKGGALDLPSRKERVNEAFYKLNPDLRPDSPEERAAKRAAADLARQEALDNCEGCKKTKSDSGRCAYHRPRRATQADYQRWERAENSPAARAGRQNGAAAARSVDVSRTAGARTQKAEPAPTRREIG